MALTTTEYHDFMVAVTQIRDLYQAMEQEMKSYGAETQESKNRQDKIEVVLQKYEAEMQKPLAQRAGLVAPDYNKSVKNDLSLTKADQARRMDIVRELPQMQAFTKGLRSGYANLTQDERKMVRRENETSSEFEQKAVVTNGFTVTEETTGGLFAPPEFVNEIIKNLVLFSPVRQYVKVRPTANRSVQFPKRTNTLITASWVGERTVRTDNTGWTIGRLEIPTNEMYGLVLISEQDLEDSEFDIEGYLRDEITEQFGVAEGKALLNGDASMQPQGLLTHPSIQATTSAANTGPDSDSMIDCLYNLPTYYASGATWFFNRLTIGLMRKLKYSGGEQSYIWQPGAGPSTNGLGPASNTILGMPYVELPDLATNAANTVVGILGDLSRAYILVDRVGMTFKRLTERWVENSQIGVYCRRRIGGQVVLPEAIRFYKIKA